jgi:PKHD-type hydroxylase
MIQLANVLPPEQLKALKELLSGPEARFQSGKATAGWAARDVKHNEQAGGSAVQKAIEEVKVALLANAIFQSAARPKEFVKLLASRYQAGMSYGTHVDDALMGGRRTDLSFTLFLSDPASYDGGELIVEAADGETDVKLPAGSLVLYQTTNLHRVAEVTRGERLAIVGWVRSFIRSPEQRDVLFEMDQVVAHLKGSHAPRENMNQALRARNMLMRMWAED